MAQLIRQLHARGLRQVLLEWPHLADWVLHDYVNSGGHIIKDWRPNKSIGGFMIDAIRVLNAALPADEQIRIGAIDVNLDESGGAADFVNSFKSLADSLDDSSFLMDFASQYPGDAIGQADEVEKLLTELADHRIRFITAWGEERYRLVIEMLEGEEVSITIRADRNDRYDRSVKMRENEIKRLADLRIAELGGLTLINIGAHHAQKRYLKGTRQEWLGDYLAHKSPAAGGPVYSVAVMPARGEPGTGGSIADFDILDTSPETEIFRVMNETWPESYVFLPITSSVFSKRKVVMNSENTLYSCRIGKIYDALLLLPIAHWEPPPGA